MTHTAHIAAFYAHQERNSLGQHWLVRERLQRAFEAAWRAAGYGF